MNLKTLKSKEIMPGFHGKMVHGENLTWAFWTVEKDAVVPEHHHPHEQIMHVVSGEFEFTLEGKTKVYKEGDVVRNAIFCGSNDTHQVIHIPKDNMITFAKIITL